MSVVLEYAFWVHFEGTPNLDWTDKGFLASKEWVDLLELLDIGFDGSGNLVCTLERMTGCGVLATLCARVVVTLLVRVSGCNSIWYPVRVDLLV